ncbi:MAG: TRAM domain-containing protein [Chthoniobacteraceae bacterium]
MPGQEFDVAIHDVAFGGNGVARLPDGRAAFVPGVITGEKARIIITRERNRFVEARLLEVLEPSPQRVPPPCPYYGRCGGCTYQHIAYAEQLAIKRGQVEQVLRRIGGFASVPEVAVVASPQEYGFRNRVTIHAKGGRAGFFARQSHDLVEIEQCLLAAPAVNEKLPRLRAEIRAGKLEDGAYVVSQRARSFFEQTNDAVAAALVERARQVVGDDCEQIVDAYCGAGFFARALVGHAPRIIGIEINEKAIAKARSEAGETERYLAADVAQVLGEILAEGGVETAAKTLVVLDPPAAGLSARVVDHLLAAQPARLLYVSCHPATLARDLKGLAAHYMLDSVTAFDMFPQTAEIEVMVTLRRK